jgi:NAD(P)-dependent dehydrogenase (short-subunit alcohol dehydrogenase family)
VLAARGASLAMIDVADEVEARAAALPNARGYRLDVAARAAYERALDQIEHESGSPEVLVNNRQASAETSVVGALLEVLLNGAFFCPTPDQSCWMHPGGRRFESG